jgi:hypothetical protein
MASEDWDEKWFPAVQGEFEYMKQIGAGYAVDRSEVPTGEQILDSKIDLQIKYSPDASYVKHKARWVALGNLKWKDPLADYYSPMGGDSTLKLFFQLAVSLQLDMFSIDIKQAFVNSKLPKPVYVRIPKGLAGDEEVIWKMENALYGLPESPQVFFKDLSKNLLDWGYIQHPMDECVFSKSISEKEYIWLHVTVDDFAVFSSSPMLKQALLSELEGRFEITIKDTFDSHLGMNIQRHPDGAVTLTMPKLLDEMEDAQFGRGWRPVDSPMDSNFSEDDQDKSPRCSEKEFRGLLGKLLFVVKVRPDIGVSIARLAKRSHVCTEKDSLALHRVLRYLLTTREEGLTFMPAAKDQLAQAMKLFAYADAAFCVYQDQKSHGGYCIKLGSHDTCMFLSRSHSHKINATSSTESEVVDLCEVTKEIIYLREFLMGLGVKVDEPTILYCDNKSAITLGTTFSGNKKRVKHFLKQVHFLLDNVKRSEVKLEWLQGSDMTADALSKPLSARDHSRHKRSLLGPQRVNKSAYRVCFASQVVDPEVVMEFNMLDLE